MTLGPNADSTFMLDPEDHDPALPSSPRRRTPLPLLPLLVIFFIQASEAVTATVIFPFINKLILEIGITNGDERQIGYFAGFIESLFFFSEAATVYHWGAASDWFGRKPILLLGPLGVSIAMLGFGLSSKFWMLIFFRSLQGVFNGNIGVSKTVVAEITDETNVADAYSMTMMAWSVGSTIGPTIGGLFSEPATRWPVIFERLPLFVRHPFFLPCAVAALVPLVSVPCGAFGLKETAPSRISLSSRRTVPINSSTTFLDDERSSPRYGTVPASSRVKRLHLPAATLMLWISGLNAFCSMSGHVLRPLVWSTSTSLGGLGFDPYRIGMILGAWGFFNALVQITFMGTIIRRIGPRNILIFSFIGYSTIFSLSTVSAIFVRWTGEAGSGAWIVLIIQLFIATFCFASFASIQILVAESTPREHLGAASGLVQAASNGMRGLAPTVASSLFSVSIEHRLIQGDLVFHVLAGVGLVGTYLVLRLPPSLKNRTF